MTEEIRNIVKKEKMT